MARVWVAMSGGVDSSVSAALLLEQGHDVTGVTMQLLPNGDHESGCCSSDAVRDARRVCDSLGIPHHVLNFREHFEREVIAPFARAYGDGLTPNPCIRCNSAVKFSELLARVCLHGADLLATGHYARVITDPDGDRWLARARYLAKDQSYFLYGMTGAQLGRVAFPVGDLTKPQVRQHAERLGLSTAQRPESQDICFVADGQHLSLIAERVPSAFVPGDIVDQRGNVLGSHQGIAAFTVGQRKGIGVGGAGEPLYVVAIDAPQNKVIVGPRSALAVSDLSASATAWRGPAVQRVHASVRYRMSPAPAVARCDGELLSVRFDQPLFGVAPGQSVVCYRDDIVIGGGEILCAT